MNTDYNKKANRVLGLVFVLFAAAAVFKYNYPQNLTAKMLYSVFEAALVGGLADWFAVTALFRRPLGFPWHTALIPANRAKMIEAIAAGVQNELLSKESIKRRLAGVRLVDLALAWLQNSGHRSAVRQLAAQYAHRLTAGIDPRPVARFGQKLLKYYLRETDLADKMKRLLEWAAASGQTNRLFDFLLAEAVAIVRRDATRDTIKLHLERYKESAAKSWWQKLALDIAELTDTINMADAAAVLQTEAEQFLLEMEDENHPLRRWLNTRLAAAAHQLGADPQWRKIVADWQHGLIRRLDLEDTLATVAGLVLEGVSSPQAADWLARQADKVVTAFETDRELQEWVEARLKSALSDLIDIEHNLVATIVKEALQRLSDNDLNRFVEDKAGEDLAWIRINGSIVGGIVGLLLFLFLRYLYSPYIQPLLATWFY